MKVLEPRLKLKIRGVAREWPKAHGVISNLDLLKTNPETKAKPLPVLEKLAHAIFQTYGVSQRYMTRLPWKKSEPGSEASSESLALEAVKKCVGEKGSEIQAFVLGSTTSRRYTGSQAASILGKLGVQAPAFETKAGCSTSLASLHFAQALFAQGYENVVVSCAETLSKTVHPDVRETWFGLADGASAIWFEKADAQGAKFEVLRTVYSTDGRYVDLYTTPGELPPNLETVQAGGYFLSGDGAQLRELALEKYRLMIEALIPDSEERRKLKWILPHQVNRGLIDEVIREQGLGGALIWDAGEFGNLGGSSVLFSFAHALERGIFKPGDSILMMSVGGGLSYSAQLWRCLG